MSKDNVVEVVDFRPVAKSSKNSNGKSIRFTFPCAVLQVDTNAVEIEMVPSNELMFSQSFCDRLKYQMGETQADRFLTEMEEHVTFKSVLAQVR